jgi:hypothetical protein
MTRSASGGYVFSDDESSTCPADTHATGCPCPVGGDIVYRAIEPGDTVRIVSESVFRGMTGTVISIYEPTGTHYVRGVDGWVLPFGASEVAL